jgi:hypothetical protein
MASIRLDREEVRTEQLPGVCMRCGQPATVYKNKSFSWHPPWVLVLLLFGLLPWAIVALILTKRMTVSAPLCEKHRNHWLIRTLIIVGSLVLVIVGTAGALFAVTAINEQQGNGDGDLAGTICLGGGVVFLVWLVAAVIVQSTAIRPSEITDYT